MSCRMRRADCKYPFGFRGPRLSFDRAGNTSLRDSRRAEYVPASDAEALEATTLLARTEGIIPALESAHAVAEAYKTRPENETIRPGDRKHFRPRR